MSRIDKGKKVSLRYRENDGTGKAVLVVEVSADDDILPHEHREDMRNAAAAILQVPVSSLEGVEVELKRTGGDHSHPGDHDHAHPHPVAAQPEEPAKQKA
ncbi:MAG: hypothetical protein ABI867_32835 [Kofleriaceae bacterium]